MLGGSRATHGDMAQMRARSADLFAMLHADGAGEAQRLSLIHI